MPPDRTCLTPRQAARALGVRDGDLYAWIAAGLLRASDLAAPGSRPRYRVSPAAIEEFLAAREIVPAVRQVRRRARRETEIIQFF